MRGLQKNPLPRPVRAVARHLSLAVAALAVLGCAHQDAPDARTLQSLNNFPLLATSQQAGVFVPQPVAPAPAPAVGVTQAWMEEQLRKFDDRYAQAAGEIKSVFEQSTALMKNAVTQADLKPITASIGKLSGDLTALSGRMEGMLGSVQTRLDRLEKGQQAAAAPAPAPAAGPAIAGTPAAPTDPDLVSFLESLKALQATPRQSLPLRSWLEVHPEHAKAPEALFQLGMSLFDRYPTASQFYFKRLIAKYPQSPQAAEAKALIGTRKSVKKPVQAAKASDCDPKTACGPDAAPAKPAESTAPPSKPADTVTPAAAPKPDSKAPAAAPTTKPESKALAPGERKAPPKLILDSKTPQPESKGDGTVSGAGFLPRPASSPVGK